MFARNRADTLVCPYGSPPSKMKFTSAWTWAVLAVALLLAGCASARANAATSAPPTGTPTVALPLPTATRTASPSPSPTDSPPSIPTHTPTPIPDTVILFTGDINPGRCVYAYAKAANDMALPYRGLAEILQSADITVGSLDGTFSDYNPPPPCDEHHRNLLAPAEAAQGLAFAGFDVMTVATNHAKDCGIVRGCKDQSLLDTLDNLRAVGVAPVGGGKNLAEAVAPVILTVNGTRFAFLGFSAVNNTIWASEAAPGTAPFLPEVYAAAIEQARAHAEVVIVLPQWGREFTPRINWPQYQGAQALVAAGPTLVIGNNPHHVQGVQTFDNGAVAAYALGNFVFDQQWTDGTEYTVQGLMLKATFHGAELQGVELIPIHIYDNFQPRLAPPEEAAHILQVVEESLALGPGN